MDPYERNGKTYSAAIYVLEGQEHDIEFPLRPESDLEKALISDAPK
jgi:hypothetical protein